MDNLTPLLDALTDAEEAIKRAATALNEPSAPTVPELYHVLGDLVALTRATRGFLDHLPTLTEFDPSEHYHSHGKNPAESLEHAEFALGDVQQALSTAVIALNNAWAHLGGIGRHLPETTPTN